MDWGKEEERKRENRENSGNLAGIGVETGDGVWSETGRKFFENQTQREWLSTEEAANFLSISANALRIMVHRDQIRAFKLGRRLRFRVQDCRQLFLKKGE